MHQLQCKLVCLDLLFQLVPPVRIVVDEQRVKANVLTLEQEELALDVAILVTVEDVGPRMASRDVRELGQNEERYAFRTCNLKDLAEERLADEKRAVWQDEELEVIRY